MCVVCCLLVVVNCPVFVDCCLLRVVWRLLAVYMLVCAVSCLLVAARCVSSLLLSFCRLLIFAVFVCCCVLGVGCWCVLPDV